MYNQNILHTLYQNEFNLSSLQALKIMDEVTSLTKKLILQSLSTLHVRILYIMNKEIKLVAMRFIQSLLGITHVISISCNVCYLLAF